MFMSSRNAGIGKIKFKRMKGKRIKIKNFSKNLSRTDFSYLMKKQNGLCACEDCAKNNDGARHKVGSVDDMCLVIPIRIWDFKEYKGDPNDRSNRQLLCPTCRKIKMSDDRKKYAKLKRKIKKNSIE